MIQQGMVIELATFRLKPGVDTATFVKHASELQAPLKNLPGFLSRTLARADEDGQWVDILVWRDMESAQSAMQAIHEVPQCAPFMGMIDPEGDKLLHLDVVPLD